jgi:hypothetical protein
MLAIARTTTLPYRCFQPIQQQFTPRCQIAATPSRHGVTHLLGLLFSVLFDSLAPVLINWLRARSRVSTDTEPTISVGSLLTTTSRSYRVFTIVPEVIVSVSILTCLSVFKTLSSLSSPTNPSGLGEGLQGG